VDEDSFPGVGFEEPFDERHALVDL